MATLPIPGGKMNASHVARDMREIRELLATIQRQVGLIPQIAAQVERIERKTHNISAAALAIQEATHE